MKPTTNCLIAIALVAAMVGAGVGCGRSPEPTAPTATLPVVYSSDLTPAERSEFYHLAEGSEVLPVDVFFSLENEAGDGLFTDHLERFGLIPDAVSDANPFGLPVGITSAETRDLRFAGVRMVGTTCAACHVSEVVYNGKRIRLDGGSTHADVEGFLIAMVHVLTSTIENPDKFLRFMNRLRVRAQSEVMAAADASRAAQVFKSATSPGGQSPASAFDRELTDGVRKLLDGERGAPALDLRTNRPIRPGATVAAAARAIRQRLSSGLTRSVLEAQTPTSSAQGSSVAANVPAGDVHARVDAFLTDAVVTLRLLKARLRALPVGIRTLGGERLGVAGRGRVDAFGGFRQILFSETPIPAPVGIPDLWSLAHTEWLHWDADTTSVVERNLGQSLGMGAVFDRQTMSSAVSLTNLSRLEQLSLKTRPPSWEQVIGPIDRSAADRGAALFKTHCASCHGAPGAAVVLPALEDTGTDPNRIRSVAQPIGQRAFADALADMLNKVKMQTAKESGITPAQLKALEGSRVAKWRTTGRYAARPLVGIWATAPYLHNNSVPTMADLLAPSASRPTTFFAGSTEYDAVKMGYRSTEEPGAFKFDTTIPGNGNAGHNYGTNLTQSDRAALIEYLKGL